MQDFWRWPQPHTLPYFEGRFPAAWVKNVQNVPEFRHYRSELTFLSVPAVDTSTAADPTASIWIPYFPKLLFPCLFFGRWFPSLIPRPGRSYRRLRHLRHVFSPRHSGIEKPIYQNGLLNTRLSMSDINPKPPEINRDRLASLYKGCPGLLPLYGEASTRFQRFWVNRGSGSTLPCLRPIHQVCGMNLRPKVHTRERCIR
jgi:hypothetical protein